MPDTTLRRVVRQPAYLQVAEQIKDAILDGSLVEGEPLPSERSLQETLGVGRTTVREALRALEAQGLVGRGRSGWRSVAVPSLATPLREALIHLVQMERVKLTDLLDLRLILEPAAVERAARIREPGALGRARHHLETMRQAGIDVRAYQEADVRFHVALAEASGNEALHLLMLTLREVIDRYMQAVARGASDFAELLPEATEDHADILGAIERGEATPAAHLVTQHLMRSARVLERMAGGTATAEVVGAG